MKYCLAIVAMANAFSTIQNRQHHSSPCLKMATDSTSLRTTTTSTSTSHPTLIQDILFPISNTFPSFPPLISLLSKSATTATKTTIQRSAISSFATSQPQDQQNQQQQQQNVSSPSIILPKQQTSTPITGYGDSIVLTPEEQELFRLLQAVKRDTGLTTTLRVAGGWVRDKLLATDEFKAYQTVFGSSKSIDKQKQQHQRLTTKFQRPAASLGRQGTKVLLANTSNITDQQQQQPVDIDIALDDMLGRQFANHLNDYFSTIGLQHVHIGMVLQNPQKSKHLETATLQVNQFWLDLVNLRAEAYEDSSSRIPNHMRIGTAWEDAYRRDLTINSLFYNIETTQVEDWTGRGFADLRKGMIATPLPALHTLLDDPLRILRSVRFAARLRFTMSDELTQAAQTPQVKLALNEKVSRERVGGEFDLMIRSPDPVGAVRLLVNLGLAECVIPVAKYYQGASSRRTAARDVIARGLHLLGTSHDYVADCRWSPPLWCQTKATSDDMRLIDDEESRRLLWYAALLKPIHDDFKHVGVLSKGKSNKRNENRSVVKKILIDDLKRPIRDADAIDSILNAADEFGSLLRSGCDVSATMILLSDIRVRQVEDGQLFNLRNVCSMNGRSLQCGDDEDPVWMHAMEFRYQCSKVLKKIGWLWRASIILAVTTELDAVNADMEYAIEGDILDEEQDEERDGILERFDVFAAALQNVGLIGNWDEKPLIDGKQIQMILPSIPKGPSFRHVMAEQQKWMTLNPCCSSEVLIRYLQRTFPEYAQDKARRRR